MQIRHFTHQGDVGRSTSVQGAVEITHSPATPCETSDLDVHDRARFTHLQHKLELALLHWPYMHIV